MSHIFNHDSRDRLTLFVVAFLTLATGCFWGLPSPGGKAAAGALVILDGGVPYRDFWTMYAPGQFYAVAALFWLFGRELLVQAFAVSLIRAASAVVFLVLLRRLGAARSVAWGLSAIFVLMLWTTGAELTEYPPALLLLLMTLNRLVRYFGEGGSGHLVKAGLLIGLAACFKHDVAAYVALGTAIGLCVSWLLAGERRPAAWQPPVRATLLFAASAIAACAPLAVWTAWSAGAEAWQDLFVFPAGVFRRIRGEQFPSLIPDIAPLLTWLSDATDEAKALAAVQSSASWIVLSAPQLVFVVGTAVLLAARARLRSTAAASLSLLLACMPFFWLAAHVQQNTHPYTLAVLGAGVGVVVVPSFPVLTRWRRWVVLSVTAVYAGGLLATPVVKAALVVYEWRGNLALDLRGLRGVRVPARLGEPFQAVGRFFRTHTREDEPVYVGLLRHDVIVASDPLLYMVAGRPPCCGHTELHPGVTDRASIQREIVRRMEKSGVRAIALWEFGWPADAMESRKRRTMAAVPDAGSTILDEYIAEHFVIVESHGEYHVLWRRGAPIPDPTRVRSTPFPSRMPVPLSQPPPALAPRAGQQRAAVGGR